MAVPHPLPLEPEHRPPPSLSSLLWVAGVKYLRRCKWCGCEHDTGKVVVVARYSDCSVWKCPGCGVQIDDRPAGWGGSYPIEDPTATSVQTQRCPNTCYTNGSCTCGWRA